MVVSVGENVFFCSVVYCITCLYQVQYCCSRLHTVFHMNEASLPSFRWLPRHTGPKRTCHFSGGQRTKNHKVPIHLPFLKLTTPRTRAENLKSDGKSSTRTPSYLHRPSGELSNLREHGRKDLPLFWRATDKKPFSSHPPTVLNTNIHQNAVS